MAIRTSPFKADYVLTENSFLPRVIALTLCFCVGVRASPQTTDYETVGLSVSYGGGLFARTCLPLSTLVNPEVGVPSTWFKAVCHCAKTWDSSICPEWTVAGSSNTNEVFYQNVSLDKGQCVANLFLKANIKENLGTIHLKCKLPGIRSVKRTIIIQKVGNRLPCSENVDCRYPQQVCQKEYSQSVSKICKCPSWNDIFDPINPDVCFKESDPGYDALGVKPICIFVLIAVLIAGIVMGVVKVFINPIGTLYCFRGLLLSSWQRRLGFVLVFLTVLRTSIASVSENLLVTVSPSIQCLHSSRKNQIILLTISNSNTMTENVHHHHRTTL